MQRTKCPPQHVDEVLMGCCMQVGEQALNISRRAALTAGLNIGVAATTIDYQCGSGLRALQIGAAQIQVGISGVVICGGTETMTRVPLGASSEVYGDPYSPRFAAQHEFPPNGISAELICQEWSLSRAELDSYSSLSHQRAAAARDQGRFAAEITAVPGGADDGQFFDRDEGIRDDTTPERLADLQPAFKPDGLITAGSASQVSDGAAALLLMSADRAAMTQMRPRARIRSQVCIGSDPRLGLTGPIEATRRALTHEGLGMHDVDLFEVNEAFAPVVLAWQRELQADMNRVNVNGGAIALGHPLGCSGARLMVTLLNELERRDAQLGLATLCCNGGLGLAAVIDRDI